MGVLVKNVMDILNEFDSTSSLFRVADELVNVPLSISWIEKSGHEEENLKLFRSLRHFF